MRGEVSVVESCAPDCGFRPIRIFAIFWALRSMVSGLF
jgi:hypothetical protein